jgi:PKD repeat protein
MPLKHRGVLVLVVCLVSIVALPLSAYNPHLSGPHGLATSRRSIQTLDAGITFNGSFSYSVGGGQARVTAQTVTNPNGTASGPLRFSLFWTPNGPYPSTPSFNTAQYQFTTSLAAGQSMSNIDSGFVPFTDPGNGCYYVALVLEENVSGTWTQRDYGNFSLRISSGQGCLFSFTASPTTISAGGSSTLNWSSGGTSVTIDNGVGTRSASGSTSVSPASTTTYTLTVNGTADGTPRTGQATVTVSAAAPTATFSAAPTTINAGQSSTLTWTSSNATSISIDNGVGSKPTSGNTSVSPSSTTTYTLTATGPGGTTTKTATVTVNTPAPTVSFSASPSTVGTGQASTLIWSTTNATTVTIDNGVGSQPVSGSTIVHPAVTTTYTLTANGPGGTMTGSATVTVTSGPGITFTATPAFIGAGQSSTLNWSTTNATSVSIDNGVGSKPTSGSAGVSPSSTTTYTLAATGPGGTSTASATVTVLQPPIVTFFADTTNINSGSSATLFWSVAGADTITIDQGIGGLAPNGSKTVSPHQTTTYRLTAVNVAGTTSSTVTINVSSPPPPRHRAAKH